MASLESGASSCAVITDERMRNSRRGGSVTLHAEVGGAEFKFVQLILRKIIIIVATRCHILFLRLQCTKFDLGWSCAPDPLRELTVLSRPPSWIWGSYF